MLEFVLRLPTPEELPNADETPVDNELQNLIPNLLEETLARIWAERTDWFFGNDMAVYADPESEAIVPDGFLSLGVQRFVNERLRLSYVLWQEAGIVPQWVLEVVSQTYRQEYGSKKDDYARMGVLYYVVYNPNRRRHHGPLEVYKLIDQQYVQLTEVEPYWLPELDLGIGREQGVYRGRAREWLYWFNAQGQRFLTTEESHYQAEQTNERLRARLRELGVDPDTI